MNWKKPLSHYKFNKLGLYWGAYPNSYILPTSSVLASQSYFPTPRGELILSVDPYVDSTWERMGVDTWLYEIGEALRRFPTARIVAIEQPINSGFVSLWGDDNASAIIRYQLILTHILYEARQRWPHIRFMAPCMQPTYLGQLYGYLHCPDAIQQTDIIPVYMEWGREQAWMLREPWNATKPGMPYWWLSSLASFGKPVYLLRVGRSFYRGTADEQAYHRELIRIDQFISRLPFVYGGAVHCFAAEQGHYADRQCIGTSILHSYRKDAHAHFTTTAYS